MENNTVKNACENCNNSCKCVGCGMFHSNYNKHHMYILRRFFLLALLIVVFCFGMQLGQLRAMKYSMHRGSYGMMNWNSNDSYGKGMMKIQIDGAEDAKPAAPEAL